MPSNFFKKKITQNIEAVVRRDKNSNFKFDERLTLLMIVALLTDQFWCRVRALKMLARGRKFKRLQLGSGVRFRNLANINIGSTVKLADGVALDGLGVGQLFIGDGCSIGSYSRLIVSTSYSNLGESITLGSNVAVGEFSYIGGAGGVSIGQDTIAGQYLSIHPENHVFDCIKTATRLQGVTRRGVSIGENVWIGAKVTILDNVTVGNDCVICAGAVLLAGDYPASSVIGGVPAKVIKRR